MKFQEAKTLTKSAEYAEFKRLDSYFTDAHSRIYIPVSEISDAYRRYEALHNIFFAR